MADDDTGIDESAYDLSSVKRQRVEEVISMPASSAAVEASNGPAPECAPNARVAHCTRAHAHTAPNMLLNNFLSHQCRGSKVEGRAEAAEAAHGQSCQVESQERIWVH